MNEVGFRSPELRICVICSKFRALAQRDNGLSHFLEFSSISDDSYVFLINFDGFRRFFIDFAVIFRILRISGLEIPLD